MLQILSVFCIVAEASMFLPGHVLKKNITAIKLHWQIIRDRFHRETKPMKLSYFPDIAAPRLHYFKSCEFSSELHSWYGMHFFVILIF